MSSQVASCKDCDLIIQLIMKLKSVFFTGFEFMESEDPEFDFFMLEG